MSPEERAAAVRTARRSTSLSKGRRQLKARDRNRRNAYLVLLALDSDFGLLYEEVATLRRERDELKFRLDQLDDRPDC